MFNPRFIRRAANLLQNGVVLDKNFHPHESHVSYVLQFMIDYNLYGMSYVHVPQDTLKFRCLDNNETLPLNGINPAQMQDSNQVKKVSCSILELDVNSCFILNRFQLLQSAKSHNTTVSRPHTNPGIEALWADEKLRRQQLIKQFAGNVEKLEQIPALEVPPPDDRNQCPDTVESEIFHRTALWNKILEYNKSQSETILNDSLDVTTNMTTLLNQQQQREIMKDKMPGHSKSTIFSISKLLTNSIYPEECSQDSIEKNRDIINASTVLDHLSRKDSTSSESDLEMDNTNLTQDNSLCYLDDTVVDEELILNITASGRKSKTLLSDTRKNF